jgi:hypothetical protein
VRDRRSDRLPQTTGQDRRPGLLGAGEEDRELSLAASTGDVAAPREPGHNPCDVAHGASVGRAVRSSRADADDDHRERPAVALGPGDLTLELEFVAASVRDSRRRVDVHPRLDFGEATCIGERDRRVAQQLADGGSVSCAERIGRERVRDDDAAGARYRFKRG